MLQWMGHTARFYSLFVYHCGFGCMLACRITGCKGGRNIVTAGVSMNIQNFSTEEEPGHQFGFHAFGLDFLEADTPACHEGLL
jgi:hypothetical protein